MEETRAQDLAGATQSISRRRTLGIGGATALGVAFGSLVDSASADTPSPLTASSPPTAAGQIPQSVGSSSDAVSWESQLTVAQLPPSVVSVSPGATAGNYCDDINTFGYTHGPNFAIGSGMPNIQPGAVTLAHGNHAFGIGGKQGVPTNGPLGSLTTGHDNTAIGSDVLVSVTTGHSNTGLGADALPYVTTGSSNVAVGAQAVESLTTASDNVGVGQAALHSATTGQQNAAIGSQALWSNLTGLANVAIGHQSMQFGTGNYNVAVGWRTMMHYTGDQNVAIGASALNHATTGNNNTAVGYAALLSTTSGANSTAVGNAALLQTTGSWNTAVGYQSGYSVTSGAYNTCLGGNAGQTGTNSSSYMTLVGYAVSGSANGVVAVGVDHTGASASAKVQDQIALGTSNHQVQISNNATGSASAALGSNCPAGTPDAPYTWFKMMSADGTTVYLPAWK